jgi:hypothetical protein
MSNRARSHGISRRILRVVAAVVTGIAGVAVLTPAAQAAPATAGKAAVHPAKRTEIYEFTRVSGTNRGQGVAAATCLGSAIWQYTSVSPTTFKNGSRGSFTTTTRCLDINMRKSTAVTWRASACVIFVDHTSSCNYFTELSTSWKTIATNVADNTHFWVMVEFDWFEAPGTTAFQLAF